MILIVGCGLSGAVIAERYANELNKKVLIIDSRDHIGGNCYDYVDSNGILVNKYGAHLFHTNNEVVYKYVTKFGKWYRWDHTVVGKVDGKIVPIPVNITTVNTICGQNIQTTEEMKEYLKNIQIFIETPVNGKEAAEKRVGPQLYKKIFKEYTKKQWDVYPEELDATVLERIPIRDNHDIRYFSDKYQILPENGYTKWFENLINSENIEIRLNEDYFNGKYTNSDFEKVYYTGPIDRYFSGLPKLQYRSIIFKHETHELNGGYYQENSVVNYPAKDVDFTRIVEYKHFNHQKSDNTTIVKEYSTSEGDPYYPIPNEKNRELFKQYQELADAESNVIFVGRLANYKYFNMDQAIENALNVFKEQN